MKDKPTRTVEPHNRLTRCPTCHGLAGRPSIHWRPSSEGGLRECPDPCHTNSPLGGDQ